MPSYPFLSDEWITETRKLRDEYRDKVTPGAVPSLKINLVVTEVPPLDDQPAGSRDAYLDTSSGQADIELGQLPQAEARLTVDYKTARAVLVDGNIGAAMEALQLGRIRVEGDMMKLMSLAGINADPTSIELAKRIREITA